MEGLIAHCGTTKVDRATLSSLPVPERTETHQPISHARFVDVIEESLSYRHMHITRSEFAISPDGMRCFGVLQVNAEYEGVQFAIGLRNANDKSMTIGLTAGYRVFVCDNLAFSGDFRPLMAKHTKNFDLIESVSIGIDRIHRGWDPLRSEIDRKRRMRLHDDDARLLVYNAFARHKLPVSLFKAVSTAVEKQGEPHTLWTTENHFTEAFKRLQPISQYQATAKLGGIFAKEVGRRGDIPIYAADADPDIPS